MTSHETFNGVDGILRVYHGLSFGRDANQPFAVLIKSHYRW